jgi:hypothetical protein
MALSASSRVNDCHITVTQEHAGHEALILERLQGAKCLTEVKGARDALIVEHTRDVTTGDRRPIDEVRHLEEEAELLLREIVRRHLLHLRYVREG